MSTDETKAMKFIAALKAFCVDNGFELAGTCISEGVYGEITVYPIDAGKLWEEWDKNKFNFVLGE